MDAFGVGGKPENWEGASVEGPNQACFRVVQKIRFLRLFFSLFLTKAQKNALSGPTQICSWDQH